MPDRVPAGATASLTARDRRVLAFAAEHRVVLAAQVGVLLGVSAETARGRLGALRDAGYIRCEPGVPGPACYLIERKGLTAVGSRLPRPRDVDLGTYVHDVGLGWVWLAAHRGRFGAVERVISERHMRSHDGRVSGRSQPLGVRLAGVGPRGGERRHYPDLLLRCATGHQVAVELELTTKARAHREKILGGYALDARIDAVLYLVCDRRVGRAIERSAAAIGISPMVIVQPVSFNERSRRGRGRELQRTSQRQGPRRVNELAVSGLAR